MMHQSTVLPFFDDTHREFAQAIADWAKETVHGLIAHDDADATCRALVDALGRGGWLRAVVPAAYGGLHENLDVRTIAIARECLAGFHGLADFAFAMQGLGSAPISLFGSEEVKRHFLPGVAAGKLTAAFALSEPEAGSDAAALALTATPDGPDTFRLDGRKTWISNGGLADFYVVFARTGEAEGAKGLSVFVVDAASPGLTVEERIEVSAPHPLATLRFDGCPVPSSRRLGQAGEGFKVAMATLDVFRSTVGAAAIGFARHALAASLDRAISRHIGGTRLGDFQLTQASLADSATDIDAAALLVYRAAWLKDVLGARITREAAMAKMFATEMAQQVVDRAVQLHGGLGVRVGTDVEELYRDVRALRIYEGATEVQKIIIGRDLVRSAASGN